jgi:hypothetical protein
MSLMLAVLSDHRAGGDPARARAHEKQEGVHEMGVEDMFSRICSVK